jgi:hypothetical protein
MDPFSIMQNSYKISRVLLVLVILAGVGFAEDNLISAMQSLCSTARNLLALGAMLLIVAAAAVYAIGQIVGAETRARASVWATAMLTGAVIGVIIYLIVPGLIELMTPDLGVSGDDPCSFSGEAPADGG